MSIEARFDVLCLLDGLRDAYSPLHVTEIHALMYMAQLLSTYDGNPIARWGYSFAHHSFGNPYSHDLQQALDSLLARNHLVDPSGKGDQFQLVESGCVLVAQLRSLFRLGWRSKYITACCDAALNRPLPMTLQALRNEPMFSGAAKAQRTETLGSGPSVDLLYEHFEAIRQVLGSDVKDLWIAALLWLDYLKLDNR